MLEVPTLRADGLLLRPWSTADVPTVRAASVDPYIPQVTTVPESGDVTECRAFVERQWERARSGLGHSFAICVDDAAVGQIGLWPREGRASIGYWLVPAARGLASRRVRWRWLPAGRSSAAWTSWSCSWSRGTRHRAQRLGTAASPRPAPSAPTIGWAPNPATPSA
nr:GNAT family N-acetyltransferase [Actinophytocola sp.]